MTPTVDAMVCDKTLENIRDNSIASPKLPYHCVSAVLEYVVDFDWKISASIVVGRRLYE